MTDTARLEELVIAPHCRLTMEDVRCLQDGASSLISSLREKEREITELNARYVAECIAHDESESLLRRRAEAAEAQLSTLREKEREIETWNRPSVPL